MVRWGSTCNHNYLYWWLPCQYFILLMMGAWRPKHVEKVCSNKICILLHHVGVLFNQIPRTLRNPKMHYRVHHRVQNSPSFVSVLRQTDPVHVSHIMFWKFTLLLSHLSVISCTLRFLHRNSLCNSFPLGTCYMPCPPYTSWLDNPNICSAAQIKELLIMQSSPFPAASSLTDPNVLPSMPFARTVQRHVTWLPVAPIAPRHRSIDVLLQ